MQKQLSDGRARGRMHGKAGHGREAERMPDRIDTEAGASKFYRFIRPLVPRPLRPLVLRHQEVLSYLVFGALTTLVNFLVYFPLSRVVHYLAANAVAWVVAVAFAFFVNKAFVFEDARWDARTAVRQALSFAAMRLVSLGLEELILYVFVEALHCSSNVTKVIAQIVVIVSNYAFSKWVIFRRQKTESENEAAPDGNRSENE
jgi:putative flippase GtrA